VKIVQNVEKKHQKRYETPKPEEEMEELNFHLGMFFWKKNKNIVVSNSVSTSSNENEFTIAHTRK
jgi:hypothetical protein